MFVGIDLGQRRVHAVALDQDLQVEFATVVDVVELPSLRGHLEQAQVVAIDAPRLSAPRLTKATRRLVASSSRPAAPRSRCAEIALGREHGIWVPWVTPTVGLPLQAFGFVPVGRRPTPLGDVAIDNLRCDLPRVGELIGSDALEAKLFGRRLDDCVQTPSACSVPASLPRRSG